MSKLDAGGVLVDSIDCDITGHGGWLVIETDGSPDVHVVPKDDLVAHEASDDCACGPTAQMVGHGWLWSHSSLDARERSE